MSSNRGAVYEYLDKLYGGFVRPIETIVTIQTSTTQIIGNNPDRVALTLVNLSANTMWIVTVQTALAASIGIRLAPSGGQVNINVVNDSILPSVAWFATCEIAAGNMFVQEVVREAASPGGN